MLLALRCNPTLTLNICGILIILNSRWIQIQASCVYVEDFRQCQALTLQTLTVTLLVTIPASVYCEPYRDNVVPLPQVVPALVKLLVPTDLWLRCGDAAHVLTIDRRVTLRGLPALTDNEHVQVRFFPGIAKIGSRVWVHTVFCHEFRQ